VRLPVLLFLLLAEARPLLLFWALDLVLLPRELDALDLLLALRSMVQSFP
jgi:hypothetical protein